MSLWRRILAWWKGNGMIVDLLNEYRQIELDRIAKLESADGDVAQQLRDIRAKTLIETAKLAEIDTAIASLGGNNG
jgi:hypothetical protein